MAPTRRQFLAAATPAVGVLGGSGRPVVERVRCPATVDGQARIGFAGDLMLGRQVDDRWDGRDPAGIWDGTLEHLRALDGFVVNLECCLSTRGTRAPGQAYYFRADPAWAVPALESGLVSCCALANNHLMDFGPVALRDTVEALDGAGIGHPGAGEDRTSAREPAVFRAGDLTVAVLSFTDNSPSDAATADEPGIAFLPLDHERAETRRVVLDTLRRAHRHDPDLIVASLHWGPNWVVRPPPAQRAFARWLVDRGVDVVHGHSAHVIQGVEVYRGRPILYDCGDVVDDYRIYDGMHNDRSFLFELVCDGRLRALDLLPVEIVKESVRPAGEEAAAWLRDRMRTLSAPFDTPVERRGRGLRIPLSC